MCKVRSWGGSRRCLAANEGKTGEGENRNADKFVASLHAAKTTKPSRIFANGSTSMCMLSAEQGQINLRSNHQ